MMPFCTFFLLPQEPYQSSVPKEIKIYLDGPVHLFEGFIVRVCACVCVCEREKEKGREGEEQRGERREEQTVRALILVIVIFGI